MDKSTWSGGLRQDFLNCRLEKSNLLFGDKDGVILRDFKERKNMSFYIDYSHKYFTIENRSSETSEKLLMTHWHLLHFINFWSEKIYSHYVFRSTKPFIVLLCPFDNNDGESIHLSKPSLCGWISYVYKEDDVQRKFTIFRQLILFVLCVRILVTTTDSTCHGF